MPRTSKSAAKEAAKGQQAGGNSLMRILLWSGAVGAAALALFNAPSGDLSLSREKRQPVRPSNQTAPTGIAMNADNWPGNRTGIMWGPWIQYYEEVWDSPGIYNHRVQANPSVFQYNIEIVDHLLPDPLPFLQAVQATGTDAAFYLTVYPFKGWDRVTPGALAELVAFCRAVIQSGRKMILRFAPEMNGTWFSYGQHPSYFKMMWMAVWNAIKSDPIARETDMMWAVNSIQGYPFCGGNPICAQGKAWERETDTNGNGVLDGNDDPYMPYYPGDDYVDSVGMSIYHYGIQYPWLENVVPYETKFMDMIRGRNDQGFYDFYKMFCEDRNKMFAVAETGVANHVQLDQGVGERTIKDAWWQQIWDAKKELPNLFLVTFFEHIKHEEATFRDFMSSSIYHDDVNAAFQRSIHTNPDLMFANRLRPEQPWIPFGRWSNLTQNYVPMTTGDYPRYVPTWNGTRPVTTTKRTTTTTKAVPTTTVVKTTTVAATSSAPASTAAAPATTMQSAGPRNSSANAIQGGLIGLVLAIIAALIA